MKVCARVGRIFATGLANNVVCGRKLGDDCTLVMAVPFGEFLFEKNIKIKSRKKHIEKFIDSKS